MKVIWFENGTIDILLAIIRQKELFWYDLDVIRMIENWEKFSEISLINITQKNQEYIFLDFLLSIN